MPAPAEAPMNRRLAILLAMAMFVLVVDTSLMNVSIAAVVRDLDTTVSGVQSAIALEALVSAAFILIGSKVGDLIGRKKAYILGLLGYAVGASAMTLAQGLTAIIIFWAVIGGLGASLLLPAMQSLIHGNFHGPAQKKVYALVGAAAAIAAAVGPLLGGFITTFLSWRVGFLLEVVVIAVVLSGIKLVHDVPYTGPREVDVVGAVLSVLGMGGIVLGILVWQEGGEAVGALIAGGAVAMAGFGYWLVRRKRQRKATLIDPDLFRSKVFRLGITEQMLQQIALGGTMIALPIYLQMVLEYNALQAGLSLAPLSLTMFGIALLAGKKGRQKAAGRHHQVGFPAADRRSGGADPHRAEGGFRLVPARPAGDRGFRVGLTGVATEQLHAGPDLGGTGQRGGRGELRRGVLRVVLRLGVRRGDHAGLVVLRVHQHGRVEHRARPGRAATGRRRTGGRRGSHEQHPARRATRRSTRRHQGRDHPDQHRGPAVGPADRPAHPDPRRADRAVQLVPDDAAAGSQTVGLRRGHGPGLTNTPQRPSTVSQESHAGRTRCSAHPPDPPAGHSDG